jgi:hypothetical protein
MVVRHPKLLSHPLAWEGSLQSIMGILLQTLSLRVSHSAVDSKIHNFSAADDDFIWVCLKVGSTLKWQL